MATQNAMSDYLENKVLVDNLSGTRYVGLFTTSPNENNTGKEVVGGSYTRKVITFSITGSQALNNNEVVFPTATANWGLVTHFGIYDAPTSGNLLFYGALENENNINTIFTINSTDTLKFPINSLSITLD